MSEAKEQKDESDLSALLCVGDLVRPINPEYPLFSGCERYGFAVVVSVEPFVLVSERADMKWTATVSPGQFESFGVASHSMLQLCKKRLYT